MPMRIVEKARTTRRRAPGLLGNPSGSRGESALARSRRTVHALSLSLLSAVWSTSSYAAAWDLREGATEMSQRIQALHHMSLTVCVVVGVIVFGAMFYSIFAHRRSKRPEPAHFHENMRLEVIWTLIPTMILVGMAVPATTTLIEIEDNSDADLTVLITASSGNGTTSTSKRALATTAISPRRADRSITSRRRASTTCSKRTGRWCCPPTRRFVSSPLPVTSSTPGGRRTSG